MSRVDLSAAIREIICTWVVQYDYGCLDANHAERVNNRWPNHWGPRPYRWQIDDAVDRIMAAIKAERLG